jgi:hypothetical protein
MIVVPAFATDERRAMVRRDGVSVFEPDIVIQSAKGISGPVPRSFYEITSDRIASSLARPPAFRIT